SATGTTKPSSPANTRTGGLYRRTNAPVRSSMAVGQRITMTKKDQPISAANARHSNPVRNSVMLFIASTRPPGRTTPPSRRGLQGLAPWERLTRLPSTAAVGLALTASQPRSVLHRAVEAVAVAVLLLSQEEGAVRLAAPLVDPEFARVSAARLKLAVHR